VEIEDAGCREQQRIEHDAANAGEDYTLNLSIGSASAATIDQWKIDWGDGSAPSTPTGTASTAFHPYAVADAGKQFMIKAWVYTTDHPEGLWIRGTDWMTGSVPVVVLAPESVGSRALNSHSIQLVWNIAPDSSSTFTLQRGRPGANGVLDFDDIHTISPDEKSYVDSNLGFTNYGWMVFATGKDFVYRIKETSSTDEVSYSDQTRSRTWRVGDINGDGVVDLDNDFAIFVDASNNHDPRYLPYADLNGDGRIDLDNDFSIFISAYNAALAGSFFGATLTSQTITVGSEASLTFSASGPKDGLDYAVVDWGDGTISETSSPEILNPDPLVAKHVYTVPDRYTIQATGHDVNGDFNAPPVTIVVSPEFSITGPASAAAGDSLTYSAHGPGAESAIWTVTNNGNPVVSGQSPTLSFVPDQPGKRSNPRRNRTCSPSPRLIKPKDSRPRRALAISMRTVS